MNRSDANGEDRLGFWEEDGGSSEAFAETHLTGTANQIEWAERIRVLVDGEFDRVRSVLEAAALKQSPDKRSDTQVMIAILEQKRSEVMTNQQAGYFIHDWQELRDQVRKMIVNDARYAAIKARG